MIRLVFLFTAILMGAAAAAWLADHPGGVTINFQAHAVETSFAALVLLAGLLGSVVGLLVWFVGWLRREAPFIGSNRIIKQQSKGLRILNQSLVALSAGDHKLAHRLVMQAETMLPPQPMVHLIAAEAATRSGNHTEAENRYKALEKSADGRLLGLRGLLVEARRTGRESEALRLARTAFQENRKSPWVLKTLFALEVAAGHWREAEAALAKVAKEGLMETADITRHKGALLYAEAMEARLQGDKASAHKGLKKAISTRPDFIPALVALAELEVTDNNPKRAEKIIKEAWASQPHPDLAAAYKALDPAESGADWLRRVRALTSAREDHPASMLLLADALMDARAYDVAKPLLEKLTRKAPTRAAWQYRLALAHVNGENPDPIEAALAHADDGPSWHCRDCGHKAAGWSPLCPACDAFDTIDWADKGDIVTTKTAFDPDQTIALLAEPLK